MLDKLGLPANPSLRGNSWVVDASHCQGCSTQFTFINCKGQVPPFPSDVAISIVEEEFGALVGDIFERFDRELIAGSLGQVHRARLKGEDVVAKVKRPGLTTLVDIDLNNLRAGSTKQD